MKYAELIEKLKPYADKEVFFKGYDFKEITEVDFYANDDEICTLSRERGKDKVECLCPSK